MSNAAIFANGLEIGDLNVEVLPQNGLTGGFTLKGLLHDFIDAIVPNPFHPPIDIEP